MTVNRAGIFIGVNKAGNLPKLRDAAAGAKRMCDWAKAQGIQTRISLTDADGEPVEVRAISRAIRTIIKDGPPDQLIVYFAGHGVNIGYGERWLLSDAPEDPNEAINVNGSAESAHHCGIPHVVFISDACRTAAESIQSQGLSGSIIFPIGEFAGPEHPVDRFWACLVGNPAAEVRDPQTSAGEYRALYTDALLKALQGAEPQVLEQAMPDGRVVRPWPLKAYLREEMASRIAALNLKTRLIQVPDARITSDPKAWVSMIGEPLPETRGSSHLPAPEDGLVIAGSGSDDILWKRVRKPRVHIAYDAETDSVALLRNAMSAGMEELLDDSDHSEPDAGPMSFETQCGFKIRGARIIAALPANGVANVFDGNVVQLQGIQWPGTNVLVVLENGSGSIIPALPDFIAALTVADGALVDVSYEPSMNTGRWHDYAHRAEELRSLRAIAASSTKAGVFRLETDNDFGIARKMQYAKGVDPTLAVYAAYAYLDLGRRTLIRQMSGYMRDDLGARLFDIAMLSAELDNKGSVEPSVFPFFPLLAQGWALLDAHRIRLPPLIASIQKTLLPSVWTLFNAEGVDLLKQFIRSEGIR